MGILDRFLKKSNNFTTQRDYFLDILSDDPILISNDKIDNFALNSYYNTPQLASIINYSAKIASNNDLRYYNDKGEESENDILNLFNNPHPLYSEGEFWETFFKQYDLYNIVLTYKVKGIGSDISGLFILPYHLINIVPKENIKPIDIFLAQDLQDIISHYELQFDGKKYKIPTDDVWMLSGGSLKFEKNGYLQPDNITESLKYPIMNIQANYEARYSLTNNRGMLGLWVNRSTDAVGHVPLEQEEKKDIYSYFRKAFGLTKNKNMVGITNANLGFESASLPVKDMEFSQGISQDKIALCDGYNFPILLLNELEGSTYSNLDIADRNLYTKNTIPKWELVSKSINREFIETGYVRFYTGNIEALKKDDKVEAETNEINTRLVINLNSTQSMDYESKLNTLMLIADIPEDIAKEVITDKPKSNEGELL